MKKQRVINFDGGKMREIRKGKNLEIKDLYDKCCIKFYRFHYFESGEGYPTHDEVYMIAKALDIHPEALVCNVENEGWAIR